MAALAENPAEHSEDEDVSAPLQGPENEPTAKAVPEEEVAGAVEAADEDEDAAEDEDDPEAAAEAESSEPESESDDDESAEPAEPVAEAAATEDESAEEPESESELEPEPALSESEAESEPSTWEPAGPKQPRELAVIGRRLGGRYRLERMVRGFGGVFEPEPQLWVGVDELLNRRVGVDLIATEHPLVEQVARAARDAAAVPDARFVQVLDAVQDEDLLYIVTEWVPGAEQLQERLTDGPLSPGRATAMVRELAEAMVRAHEAEVTHGAMNPATVMITKAGEVKLRGLLVEATLSGAEPESAEVEKRYAADVLALGQIWYAALTARWPGTEAEYGLDAAPTDSAALYTPAQIRAAVPKQVDATVCRALGLGEHESFGTVKELADAIRSLPRLREEAPESTVVVPPRTRSAKPVAASNSGGGADKRDSAPSWSPEPESRKPVWRRRGVLAVGGCAVVALATLAAFQLTGNNKTNTTTGSISNATPHPSSGGVVSIPAGTAGKTLTISGDSIWDQSPTSGSQSTAADAYNNSGTGWKMTTQTNSNWATSGGGIGLVFNLGSAHTVDQIKFQLASAGATVEILTAPAGSSTTWNATGLTSDGFTLQKTLSNVSSGQTVTANFSATSAEYVAIIFTQLQEQDAIGSNGTPAGYRNNILDVQVLGE
ncbi:protein kinase family protein [Actinospica sp.]|uniref:protein kinase family protein n=1 Tax=Actinospica sp. TaxID=1872142 RepID=UPI002B778B09|nr:protein kinase family protein [Actinospica sp.]HWG28373.1 protein kinase family protein [Actinospica sp.]